MSIGFLVITDPDLLPKKPIPDVEYSTPVLVVPAGDVDAEYQASWTDETVPTARQYTIFLDGAQQGNSLPHTARQWPVMPALSEGVHTITLKTALSTSPTVFTSETSITINVVFEVDPSYSVPTLSGNGTTLTGSLYDFQFPDATPAPGRRYDLRVSTQPWVIGTDGVPATNTGVILDTNGLTEPVQSYQNSAATNDLMPTGGQTLYVLLLYWDGNNFPVGLKNVQSTMTAHTAAVITGGIFVSTTGNDSNLGTSTSEAFATMQKASDVAQAGDIVNIKKGAYPKGQRLVSARAGASGNLIWFRGYNSTPGDNPQLAGDINTPHTARPDLFPVIEIVNPNEENGPAGVDIGHNYIRVSNMQSVNYPIGMYLRSNVSNSHFQWVYGLGNGDHDYPQPNYRGTCILVMGTDNLVEDSFAINGTGAGFSADGARNYFKRCRSISNDYVETDLTNNNILGLDYLISDSGTDNQFDDCQCLQHNSMNDKHNGHGFGLRGTRAILRRPKTVNCGEGIRFDTANSSSGATDCQAYDIECLSTASSGHQNNAIVFEGSVPSGNLVSGGVVTQSGSTAQVGVYYGSDSNSRILAGGQNNIVEGVTFTGNFANLSHRTAEPSRNQTVRNCTFNGSAAVFFIESGHTIESNCRFYGNIVNVPSLRNSGSFLMTKAAGSFSSNGSNTNTNTGTLAASAYP